MAFNTEALNARTKFLISLWQMEHNLTMVAQIIKNQIIQAVGECTF